MYIRLEFSVCNERASMRCALYTLPRSLPTPYIILFSCATSFIYIYFSHRILCIRSGVFYDFLFLPHLPSLHFIYSYSRVYNNFIILFIYNNNTLFYLFIYYYYFFYGPLHFLAMSQ